MAVSGDRATRPLACDLSAIDAAHRVRHHALLVQLRAAQCDRQETHDGYTFRIDSRAISLAEVAEWMGLERQCCPFLTLELTARGGQDDFWLTVRGPEDAKPIIEAELATRLA